MRITFPTSSSLDVWQEWPCFMENYWMVSELTVDPVFIMIKSLIMCVYLFVS